jgi:hypothetical protein
MKIRFHVDATCVEHGESPAASLTLNGVTHVQVRHATILIGSGQPNPYFPPAPDSTTLARYDGDRWIVAQPDHEGKFHDLPDTYTCINIEA